MNEALTGQLASVTVIIIFLTLSYFYRTRLKQNILAGNERLLGMAVLICSILLAIYLLS